MKMIYPRILVVGCILYINGEPVMHCKTFADAMEYAKDYL